MRAEKILQSTGAANRSPPRKLRRRQYVPGILLSGGAVDLVQWERIIAVILREDFAMRRILLLGLLGSFGALSCLDNSSGQNPTKPTIDTATHQGYRETIKGEEKGQAKGMAAEFDMAPIPGGTFLMGSPPNEKERKPDEGPRLWVTIRPFWMGKTEVTWDEYELFLKEMGVDSWDVNEARLKANADFLFRDSQQRNGVACIGIRRNRFFWRGHKIRLRG